MAPSLVKGFDGRLCRRHRVGVGGGWGAAVRPRTLHQEVQVGFLLRTSYNTANGQGHGLRVCSPL